jgi:hypothetical protein
MTTFISLIGFAFAALTLLLIVGFWYWARQTGKPPALRNVDVYKDLPKQIGDAVENGKRIHVSLGTGAIGTAKTTGALAGLTVLDIIAEAATLSDSPPVITTADGLSAFLAQDALRRAYSHLNAMERYDHLGGRLAGPTPLSYAAGVMTSFSDEKVTTSLLIGTFGNELALMTDAGAREPEAQIIVGTDDVQAQAAAYVTADKALIGEDVYASGAYLVGGKPFHKASLQAQDVMRVLIIVAILGGAALKLIGVIP